MSANKTQLSQHRKKKYVFKERESPFPVPIASITREDPNQNYWFHYTGQIQGDYVIVTHSGDISYLQRMGFFGKGLTSRGAPSTHRDLPYVHLPSTTDGEPDVVHVMRRRMYLKHMKWKKSHDIRLGNQGEGDVDNVIDDALEDEEFDSDVDYTQTGNQPDCVDSYMPQSNPEFTINTNAVKESMPLNTGATSVAEQQVSTNRNTSTWSWNEECSKQEVKSESWENETTNENAGADLWDNMEADEDFWATEEKTSENNKSQENISETVLKNYDHSDIQVTDKKRVQDNDLFHIPNKKMKLSEDNDTTGNTDVITNVLKCKSADPDLNNGQNDKHHTDKCNSEINELGTTQEDNLFVKHDQGIREIKERTKSEVDTEETKCNVEMEISNGIEKPDCCDSGDKLNHSHTDNREVEAIQPEPLPVHPYCRDNDDDDDGDLEGDENDKTAVTEFLVIDDSDVDDSTYVVQRKEKYTWLPVKKKEIFNFNEPLLLSLEEAFFLTYGLGCLTVQDENHTNLSLTDLWCRFCHKKQFLPRYVAYHYFRSKGWVPKPSILFGTDFLVYKVGPEFYHASYSVIVKTVYDGTFEEVEDYNNGRVTWTSFFGINRVTEQVAKTLVYCYVIMPKDLSEEQKKSPDCIARFKVRLQTVQRWISSQERDKERVIDDIPDS